MGSPMTGPISEAATGPREPAAAVPAKEGLPPGPGNPGAGLLVDEGPAGRDAGPRPAGRTPRPHRRNRRKRHSIRHAWLPTVSHSHLLQRPFPSPHPFTGSSSSGEFLDRPSSGKPRGNCRRIKESLPFRTREALASHSCECARTGIGRRAEGGSRCVGMSDGSLVGSDRVRDGLGRASRGRTG